MLSKISERSCETSGFLSLRIISQRNYARFLIKNSARNSGLLLWTTLAAYTSWDASRFSTISGTHPRAPISLTKEHNAARRAPDLTTSREHKCVARVRGRSERAKKKRAAALLWVIPVEATILLTGTHAYTCARTHTCAAGEFRGIAALWRRSFYGGRPGVEPRRRPGNQYARDDVPQSSQLFHPHGGDGHAVLFPSPPDSLFSWSSDVWYRKRLR